MWGEQAIRCSRIHVSKIRARISIRYFILKQAHDTLKEGLKSFLLMLERVDEVLEFVDFGL